MPETPHTTRLESFLVVAEAIAEKELEEKALAPLRGIRREYARLTLKWGALAAASYVSAGIVVADVLTDFLRLPALGSNLEQIACVGAAIIGVIATAATIEDVRES